MSSPKKYDKPFRFRQFEIWQEHAAMKVGTDGVLIAVWSGLLLDPSHIRSVLDIGTGTGMTAIVLAQRFPQAQLVALEIEDAAILDAQRNIDACPFHQRIQLVHSAIQQWETDRKFDLIVSNPPFFEDALLNPDLSRQLARHAVTLKMDELFFHANRLSNENAHFAIILPFSQWKKAQEVAEKNGWSLFVKRTVSSFENTEPIRILLGFSKLKSTVCVEEYMFLYDAPFKRSKSFNELTEDFYL